MRRRRQRPSAPRSRRSTRRRQQLTGQVTQADYQLSQLTDQIAAGQAQIAKDQARSTRTSHSCAPRPSVTTSRAAPQPGHPDVHLERQHERHPIGVLVDRDRQRDRHDRPPAHGTGPTAGDADRARSSTRLRPPPRATRWSEPKTKPPRSPASTSPTLDSVNANIQKLVEQQQAAAAAAAKAARSPPSTRRWQPRKRAGAGAGGAGAQSTSSSGGSGGGVGGGGGSSSAGHRSRRPRRSLPERPARCRPR